MNTPILRAVAPLAIALMLIFSIFMLLRGHNAPGGGFIGGLIAVCALALHAMAFGVEATRRALVFPPLSIAGGGLLLAALAGLAPALFGLPFMTGLWAMPRLAGAQVPLSTVMAFDAGVYLVVTGALGAMALGLEEAPEEEERDP